MKVNIGTYSFGGIASYLGLGPTLLDNSTKCYSQLDCGWAQNGGCYPPSFIHTKKDFFSEVLFAVFKLFTPPSYDVHAFP